MEETIKIYKNHPGIKLVKNNAFSEDKDFAAESATVVEINNIIKYLNPTKATGPEKIPAKIVKLAANI